MQCSKLIFFTVTANEFWKMCLKDKELQLWVYRMRRGVKLKFSVLEIFPEKQGICQNRRRRERKYISTVEPNWMRLRVGYRRWGWPVNTGGGCMVHVPPPFTVSQSKNSLASRTLEFASPPPLLNVLRTSRRWFRFYSDVLWQIKNQFYRKQQQRS